jgi:ABC-type Fe3+/spermidine/putrescine transport system ATPase subunit
MSEAKIMIRPESIIVAPATAKDPNSVEGLIEDITLTGGVVDIRVRVREGTIISVRRLTTRDFRAMEPGQPVLLSVKPSDVVILA